MIAPDPLDLVDGCRRHALAVAVQNCHRVNESLLRCSPGLPSGHPRRVRAVPVAVIRGHAGPRMPRQDAVLELIGVLRCNPGVHHINVHALSVIPLGRVERAVQRQGVLIQAVQAPAVRVACWRAFGGRRLLHRVSIGVLVASRVRGSVRIRILPRLGLRVLGHAQLVVWLNVLNVHPHGADAHVLDLLALRFHSHGFESLRVSMA
mmetsp:Transcript_21956/g.41889  ORF Transcript_21956/g.41889 Transcript_21956/m.41889 type:complete len:206 (+) Transcript_21956:624-1241(+)